MPNRPPENLAPVVAVVGATASGKTALSLDLAQALGAEIINTDAMQVYRGMDIGTAKLSAGQRRNIRHHLLDSMTVREPATVAQFQQWARPIIERRRAAGQATVLVGGSALYTRAILDRFEFPGTDDAVRARLEGELAEHGSDVLHLRLADLDPEAAANILPSNGRRIVRALEVIEITGRRFSATLPTLTYHYDNAHQIGVRIERELLEQRINQRVVDMFEAGFVDEVRRLLPEGLASGRTAGRAIGYREVMAHLAGEITEAEAIARTQAATRRFARRQDSWFTKDPRILWVDHDDPDRLATVLAALHSA